MWQCAAVIVGRVAAAVAGAALVVWTLFSAVQSVVVPRATVTLLTRFHFHFIRQLFELFASPKRPYSVRDRVLALFAPVSLVLLPALWVTMLTIGFTAIFWGTGIDPLVEAFATSGSSLFTLGFDRPPGTAWIALSFVEAGLGLGIVSLMISYLPTIYSAFRTREALVGMLEVRAGTPPRSVDLLIRYHRIGWLDRIEDDLFDTWEKWFVDVEESHTSQPMLVFFRSPVPERNWLTAAGCVLDSAAVFAAVIDRQRSVRPDILLRSGFLCLRRIADSYALPYDPNPAPDDPISVDRQEFDSLCLELEAAGIALKPDREQAWRDFVGWRVNYDATLVQLCQMVVAPLAMWSSDRSVAPFRLRSLREVAPLRLRRRGVNR